MLQYLAKQQCFAFLETKRNALTLWVRNAHNPLIELGGFLCNYMFLTRKNLNGGRTLKGFPIREQDGKLGYLLGYCDHCNEMILMAMQQRDELIATFHCSDDTYKKLKKLLEPKLTLYSVFIKWVAKWVNGKLKEYPLAVDN